MEDVKFWKTIQPLSDRVTDKDAEMKFETNDKFGKYLKENITFLNQNKMKDFSLSAKILVSNSKF